MDCTWGYEMGWLVKDELPEKKRQQLMEDVRPALLTGERVLDATGGIVQVHRFGGDQGRRGTLAGDRPASHHPDQARRRI